MLEIQNNFIAQIYANAHAVLKLFKFVILSAIWHQYDDAIFSEPSRVQSLRNMMPVWKSMDVLEGRNLATWAMLNEWEDLLTVKTDTTMAAWDFVRRVGDLAYCMTNSKVEEYGLTISNVPSRYNFKQVSYQSLCCKIFGLSNEVSFPCRSDQIKFKHYKCKI